MSGYLRAFLFLLTLPFGQDVSNQPTGKAVSDKHHYCMERLSNPCRTVVRDEKGLWLATLTDGASKVTLVGPQRCFAEPGSTREVVTHDIWVRILPEPFAGGVDEHWLARALADVSPDVLAIGMQYLAGAPVIPMHGSLKIGGDADYGPLDSNGHREVGADFNDYIGVNWKYGTEVDHAERRQRHCLDCSGFIRMVYGYRCGYPLSLRPMCRTIPRKSFEMSDSGPGVVLIPNTGERVPETKFARLEPGDLVSFDADTGDGTQIDHVGIYLGRDGSGNYRFLSSRKSINGPTIGDCNGDSILNRTGFYAKAFRSARRF